MKHILRSTVLGLVVFLTTMSLAQAQTSFTVQPEDRILGNKNAPVTMLVFEDLQCPFCQMFYNNTIKAVLKNHKDDVRVVMRHYPLSTHKFAVRQAYALECAAEAKGEKGFRVMLNYMFNKNSVPESTSTKNWTWLMKGAKRIGMDPAELKSCAMSHHFLQKVRDDIASAGKITGIPTTFIWGPDSSKEAEKIEGAQSYDFFKEKINALLGQ